MFSSKKPKGSSLLIALGIMSILLVLSGAISNLIVKSLRASSNIENSNKAYFASEAGLEEALYDLSAHLSGYENSKGETLANKSKYEYEIEYRPDASNSRIPRLGEGNSPTDPDWNRITPQTSYNLDLFYDNNNGSTPPDFDCSDGCDIRNQPPTSLSLYLRTPNDTASLPTSPDEVFLSWTLSGIDKDDSDIKYTLIPTETSKITASKINNNGGTSPLLDQTTEGQRLDATLQTVIGFLSTANLHIPRLKISITQELIDNIGDPIPYLEFYIEADSTLPDSYATITSEGYIAGSKQTLQTKIKQTGSISLFDYAVFQ